MNRARQASGPIDWGEVHERLDRSAAVLAGGTPLADEQVQAILDERARVLARVPERPLEAAERIEVVAFALAGERLALETRFVRRVLSRWEATPVPGAPEVLVGVTNLQGDVLALFDLRILFGMARTDRPASALLLVLGEEAHELGILVDAVDDMRPLRVADLLEPPASLARLGRGVLRGVTEDALIVIDGHALLADERLFIQQGDEPGA